MRSFVDSKKNESLQATIARVCDASEEDMRRLEWSGLFTDEPVGLSKGTPAQVLEHILNKKWKLQPNDKDMIVMWHRFGYLKNGVAKRLEATLIAKGANAVDTAMAKTVGLPLAIVAKLLMQGKIQLKGVVIPTAKEIYEPVLKELSSLGVELTEWES
jgi:saccharopine dehydrogenase (NADP+, L-glutamate forming)